MDYFCSRYRVLVDFTSFDVDYTATIFPAHSNTHQKPLQIFTKLQSSYWLINLITVEYDSLGVGRGWRTYFLIREGEGEPVYLITRVVRKGGNAELGNIVKRLL